MEELCKDSAEESEWEDLKAKKHHVRDPIIVKTKHHACLIFEKIHASTPRKTKKIAFFFLLPMFFGYVLGVSLLLCHLI